MSSYFQNDNSVNYGQYGGYDQECPSDDEGDESAALFAGSMAPDDDEGEAMMVEDDEQPEAMMVEEDEQPETDRKVLWTKE